MVILVQLFIVMFGLDPNIHVKQRSLFLPWIPVSIPRLRLGHEDDSGRGKPEYDRKRKSAKASGTRMTADGSSPNMTLENFHPNKASTL